MIITLTDGEAEALRWFLKRLHDDFGDHGCNDVEPDLERTLSVEDKDRILKWVNGDRELGYGFIRDEVQAFKDVLDYEILAFLHYKLFNEETL